MKVEVIFSGTKISHGKSLIRKLEKGVTWEV